QITRSVQPGGCACEQSVGCVDDERSAWIRRAGDWAPTRSAVLRDVERATQGIHTITRASCQPRRRSWNRGNRTPSGCEIGGTIDETAGDEIQIAIRRLHDTVDAAAAGRTRGLEECGCIDGGDAHRCDESEERK